MNLRSWLLPHQVFDQRLQAKIEEQRTQLLRAGLFPEDCTRSDGEQPES